MASTISIITPSFRQLDWLRLAMASVADQQGVSIEHIVQDGETDGVREVFEKVSAIPGGGDYVPRLFVEKDNGMYDAINRGLARSTGEICGYLNCDEQYFPSALRAVADYFAANPNID